MYVHNNYYVGNCVVVVCNTAHFEYHVPQLSCSMQYCITIPLIVIREMILQAELFNFEYLVFLTLAILAFCKAQNTS